MKADGVLMIFPSSFFQTGLKKFISTFLCPSPRYAQQQQSRRAGAGTDLVGELFIKYAAVLSSAGTKRDFTSRVIFSENLHFILTTL